MLAATPSHTAVPNLNCSVPIGSDFSSSGWWDLGLAGGEFVHTLAAAEMPVAQPRGFAGRAHPCGLAGRACPPGDARGSHPRDLSGRPYHADSGHGHADGGHTTRRQRSRPRRRRPCIHGDSGVATHGATASQDAHLHSYQEWQQGPGVAVRSDVSSYFSRLRRIKPAPPAPGGRLCPAASASAMRTSGAAYANLGTELREYPERPTRTSEWATRASASCSLRSTARRSAAGDHGERRAAECLHADNRQPNVYVGNAGGGGTL